MLAKLITALAIFPTIGTILLFIIVCVFKSRTVEGYNNESNITTLVRNLKSRAKYIYSEMEDEFPEGLVLGSGFMAYVNVYSRSNGHNGWFISVRLLAFSKETITMLVVNDDSKYVSDDDTVGNQFNILRFGTSRWAGEVSNTSDTVTLPEKFKILRVTQARCISKMETYIATSDNSGSSFLLYGIPGTGKTSIGYILANKYHYDILLSDLTSARVNIYSILSYRKKTTNKKLIIQIDEFDVVYAKLKVGLKSSTSSGIRVIYDIATLHAFIDYISVFTDHIVILTTNQSPTYFGDAFIRKNRTKVILVADITLPEEEVITDVTLPEEEVITAVTLPEEKVINQI